VKTLRETIAESIYRHPNRDVSDAYKIADDALATVREWLEKNGLAVVPRDPSDAMAEAGWSVRGTQFEPTPDAQEIYRAMIAAAPDVLGKP
jgi:hypothetical protein